MFQEIADQLTDDLTRAGNAIAKARKNGVCTHSWLLSPNGIYTCGDCGQVFASFEDAMQAGKDAMLDYM